MTNMQWKYSFNSERNYQKRTSIINQKVLTCFIKLYQINTKILKIKKSILLPGILFANLSLHHLKEPGVI